MKKTLSYKSSGVNIDTANSFVDFIKKNAEVDKHCVSAIGGFASLFSVGNLNYKDPVIAAATDGVGTKLLIANECNNHASIGIDLVAMCANDLICHGAKPLFFLDYYSTGKLELDVARAVISGILVGCREASMSLVGGETAEMPGLYSAGEYDLAGFAVGIVEKEEILPQNVTKGDILIGLKSSGFHANGFSLIRKTFSSLSIKYSTLFDKRTWGEILLTPTKIYVNSFLSLKKFIKAAAHITGGGLLENLRRVLPEDLKICIQPYEFPEIFKWLMLNGNIPQEEMLTTFNCGIGMVLVVAEQNAEFVSETLGEEALIIGNLK
ncbi:phosphoribosylformylglycinamidine cyclo-ligase [Neorickettsia sennetsu]|uniref:Phosphoribosylformylglycinamidine cyclo-ligase n=1 Tax=Ehrlichia sennetsu (strain ATCC VR-367 / Miyayama) TaxID=222891 RepID=Q2GF22_EHRS3|nr:phosphoribosylformylglycinamidine cyclo-ligase [Neorickettsia sennetsu]ABD45633.1 phosphoribosylformylglycinamidine cyclo-ligase [Neorickettsia sennetsu str. Miyayama]